MKIGRIEQAVSLYGFEQRLVDVPEYGVADMFAELNALGIDPDAGGARTGAAS